MISDIDYYQHRLDDINNQYNRVYLVPCGKTSTKASEVFEAGKRADLEGITNCKKKCEETIKILKEIDCIY